MRKMAFFALILVLLTAQTALAREELSMVENMEKVAPYLYEAWFNDYWYDGDLTVFPEGASFACSAVRNGNLVGRNFDFYFNDIPEFVVHVAGDVEMGRLASIGVAMHNGITEEGMEKGEYGDEILNVLPNLTLDGINEAGVSVLVNVVPRGDCGELTGTNPGAETLHAAYVPRYVLDHATSADHAVELLKECNICGRYSPDFDLHFMISDAEKSLVVEFIDNRLVASEKNIMTNFHLNWNARDVSEYGFCETGEEWDKAYTPHAMGVERFIYLRDHYAESETPEGMQALLKSVCFSGMFHLNAEPFRYSEWLQSEGYTLRQAYENPEELKAKIADFCGFVEKELDKPLSERVRTPAPGYCVTVHNSTYDLENGTLTLFIQEDYERSCVFSIDD